MQASILELTVALLILGAHDAAAQEVVPPMTRDATTAARPAHAFVPEISAAGIRQMLGHDSNADGAAIGAVIGGGAGAFLLVLGASYGGNEPTTTDWVSSILIGALAGGVTGALIDDARR